MRPPSEDSERRRPVWRSLSELFLDIGLEEWEFERIAAVVLDSGYTPSEVRDILWQELFPIIEVNVRGPAGVWDGYPVDWLEGKILQLRPTGFQPEQRVSASIIVDEWRRVLKYLPSEFSAVAEVDPSWISD
jgi:hypothetical protein